MPASYVSVSIIIDQKTEIDARHYVAKSGHVQMVARIDQVTLIFATKEDLDRIVEGLSILSDAVLQGIE